MSARLVREPWWAAGLRDALRLVLFVTLCAAVAAVVAYLPPARFAWLDLPGRILAGLSTELMTLVLLRVVLPGARPGDHRVDWNGSYLRWLVSSAFNDVALMPMVRAPFSWLQFGRVLYLKALGARMPWTVRLPAGFEVRDPSLWVLGFGAQIEPGVVIESALHGAGRVHVDRVVVGPGCLVGAQSVLMPGAILARDVRVGVNALIGDSARIGVGVQIGAGAQVEPAADVGSYAAVGPGALIGAGAKIGDRARIYAGAVVPAETIVPERAHVAAAAAAPESSNTSAAQAPSAT